MDGCHHYGQKQEGACQLHDPHKTEQEILAGYEREREGSSFSFLPPLVSLMILPALYCVLFMLQKCNVTRETGERAVHPLQRGRGTGGAVIGYRILNDSVV